MASAARVLVLSGVQGDTRRYRTHHLYEQLRLTGLEGTLAHLSDPGLFRLAAACDLLILHRVTADRVSLRLLSEARRRRVPVILDVDDLVFDPQAFQWIDSPDFADPIRARLYQENMRRNREILESSDAVTASTGFLAERARALGRPVWVHRNGFSLEMLCHSRRAERQPSPETRIGYASGTRTHDQDFALARPALQDALRAHPGASLWLIGRLDPGPGWDAFAGRVRRLPFVPWRQLPGLLACLDINLAPLRLDNPFCQSKSEIKYMEAGLVGVPSLASPTEAFAHAIRSGENSLLASSPEEWRAGLAAWLADPALRARASASARQDVLERFSPWARAGELAQTLQEMSTRLNWGIDFSGLAAPGPLEPEARRELWISAALEDHPTLLERGLYSLRSRGARTLGREVWIYLRRLLEPLFPFKERDT